MIIAAGSVPHFAGQRSCRTCIAYQYRTSRERTRSGTRTHARTGHSSSAGTLVLSGRQWPELVRDGAIQPHSATSRPPGQRIQLDNKSGPKDSTQPSSNSAPVGPNDVQTVPMSREKEVLHEMMCKLARLVPDGRGRFAASRLRPILIHFQTRSI